VSAREAYDKIEAVNYSSLKYILESPAKYKAMLSAEKEDDDETRFAVGTLAHAMVLEGKDLRDLFALKPKGMSFASTVGKEWKAQQTLPIIKEEDANAIPRMAEAIALDPDASKVLMSCPQRELVLQANLFGIEFKAMLDAVGKDVSGTMGFVDIKTTAKACSFSFAKKVRDLSYDLQIEIYRNILKEANHTNHRPWSAWIVVETSAPYEVATYYPDAKIINEGREKLGTAIDRLKKCIATGIWPKALGGLTCLEAAPYFKPELVSDYL
jgi:hypothetical protein